MIDETTTVDPNGNGDDTDKEEKDEEEKDEEEKSE